MKRGRKLIHIAFFILLTILTVWLSIGLVSAIEESVDGGWTLASGSNADEDMEPEETASPSDAEEDDEEPGTEATPSDATPSEAEPGGDGQDQEEGDSSEELEWDPIPEFEQDEHVVFEMKPLYLDTNASTWNLLKGVNAHDQDGNALEVTLAEGEGNFYKASTDYEEARSMSDSADGELATLRKGRYYEVVQAWDAVDECMNKAARIIYVGSPEDFTQDKIPGVATGSDAMLDDMELATGSNALRNVTFEMEPLYLSPTTDVTTLDLTSGAKAVDEEGNELPVFLVDKGTFTEAYMGPGSRKSMLRSNEEEDAEPTENQQEGQTLVEGSYYVTIGAENTQEGIMGTSKRSIVVGNTRSGIQDSNIVAVTYPVSGEVVGYDTGALMKDDIVQRGEVGEYKINILANISFGQIWSWIDASCISKVTVSGADSVEVALDGWRYYCKYPVVFESITFDSSAMRDDCAFIAQGNHFEFGDNVILGTKAARLTICGGLYDDTMGLLTNNVDIVIKNVTVGDIYAQSTAKGTVVPLDQVNVNIQNATVGSVYCGNADETAVNKSVQIVDTSATSIRMYDVDVGSVQNTTIRDNCNMKTSNCDLLDTTIGNELINEDGKVSVEGAITTKVCILTGENELYLKKGASVSVTEYFNLGTVYSGTVYMQGDNIIEGGTALNLVNLVSTGGNNVLRAPIETRAIKIKNNLDGKVIIDTSVGEIADITLPAQGIQLVEYGGEITDDFMKQIELLGMPESTALTVSGSSIYWKTIVYQVIEPNGTKTAATSISEACTFINTKEEVGIYKILLGEDTTTAKLNPTKGLGPHVDKLVIEGVGEERKIQAAATNNSIYYKNTELCNVLLESNTTGTKKVKCSGITVTFGDKTRVASTIQIIGDTGAETKTNIVIKNGCTFNGIILRGTASSMEVRLQGFGGTLDISGYVKGMAEGTDIVIDSTAPITINSITGLGKLVLNPGSNLTVNTSITCEEGLGEVQFKGDSTLSLPGTQTAGSQFGSLVIDGSNNRLELVPANSSGTITPVSIIAKLSGQGGISGTGKLRLAPVSGKPSGSVGMKLIGCSTSASAQPVYFEDEFDGGELYVAADPATGMIRVSEPLKYLQVINGNTKSYHSSLKKAIQKIGTGMESYKIVFAKQRYTITSDDVKALGEYGLYATEITYTGTYTLSADDILQTGESIGQTVTRDIYIDDDIEFPSKTRIEEVGILFNKDSSGIYAGGKELTIGRGVSFKGSNIPVLYGGSSDKNVTKTSVTVDSGIFHSIYGGGNGTDVMGATSVTVSENVTVEALSGGSAGSGSVSGERLISLPGSNTFDSIVDFDKLNIGDSAAGVEVTVNGTLDSDSGLTAEEVRTGLIYFQGGSTLTLNGNVGATLAAGTLRNDSSQNNRLLLTKSSSGVNGMTIAKCVNEAVGTPLKLGLTSGSEAAEIMDPLLILTNRSAVSANSFKLDGLSFNLFISKGTGNGGSLCLGLEAEPGGELLKVVHQLADGTVTAPEDGTAKPGKKVFLQLYDIDMTDPDGAGAGLDTDTIYIDSSSALSQSWMTDDLIPATGAVVEIDDPEGDGKHTWTGSAVIDEVDASKVYYVHLKDKMGNYAIFPIDTLGPGRNGDIETAAVNGGFSIKLKLSDPFKNSQSGIAYKAGGISQAGWSTTEKDTEALLEDFSLSTLSGIQKVNPATGTYDYQFKVTAADMNGNTSMIIYAYVKDSYGNTSKIAVPVSQYIMNVSVPSKVGVVAVKGGEAPKLLTPDCYITNQGFFPIKISVEMFTHRSATASNAIKVVDKSGGFGEDEINLKLLPLSGSATFAETPVAGIGEAAPLELGTIPGAGSAGNKLGFKFGADFDQYTLKELTGWEPFVMSYKLELAVQQ